MKKRLAILVTCLAALLAVGTGAGTWLFSENTNGVKNLDVIINSFQFLSVDSNKASNNYALAQYYPCPTCNTNKINARYTSTALKVADLFTIQGGSVADFNVTLGNSDYFTLSGTGDNMVVASKCTNGSNSYFATSATVPLTLTATSDSSITATTNIVLVGTSSYNTSHTEDSGTTKGGTKSGTCTYTDDTYNSCGIGSATDTCNGLHGGSCCLYHYEDCNCGYVTDYSNCTAWNQSCKTVTDYDTCVEYNQSCKTVTDYNNCVAYEQEKVCDNWATCEPVCLRHNACTTGWADGYKISHSEPDGGCPCNNWSRSAYNRAKKCISYNTSASGTCASWDHDGSYDCCSGYHYVDTKNCLRYGTKQECTNTTCKTYGTKQECTNTTCKTYGTKYECGRCKVCDGQCSGDYTCNTCQATGHHAGDTYSCTVSCSYVLYSCVYCGDAMRTTSCS